MLDENGLRRPSAQETEAILLFLAIVSELHNYEADLTPRLSEIPNGMKNYRWVRSVLTKMIPQILETIPEGKRRYLKRMAQDMIIHIKYTGRGASKASDGEWTLMHTEDVQALIEASKEVCLICLDGQCNRCPIGKALDNIVPDLREEGETWNDFWFRARIENEKQASK